MAGVSKYLRYTAKIGDYLQMSDYGSVMLMDHEHRKQVIEEGREWDNIDGDTVIFHLKAPSSNSARAYPKVSTPSDSGGKPICRRFNRGQCFSPNCRYSHICFTCKGDHPKLVHTPAPQHFQAPHQAQGGYASS